MIEFVVAHHDGAYEAKIKELYDAYMAHQKTLGVSPDPKAAMEFIKHLVEVLGLKPCDKNLENK